MVVACDTFLTTVYTVVDDWYRAVAAPTKPVRRGHQPEMSDSEVLTLQVCQQWLGWSERLFLAYVARHWRDYFPRLLDQSSYNRRTRDLAGCAVQLIGHLARLLGETDDPYQVIDGVPVPLARIARGRRHRLFAEDEAAVGRGGVDRRWYFGVKLVLAVQADGVITGFVVGPASTGERWLVESLLCWRHDPQGIPWTAAQLPPSHRRGGGYVGPTGPLWPVEGAGQPRRGTAEGDLYLTDAGMTGSVWGQHWLTDYRAEIVTVAETMTADDVLPRREHAVRRQVIETVNQHLTADFHLPFPQARSRWGLLSRIAAKLAAFNLGMWLNRQFGRPDFALASLFPR
ncbi:MAG: hypothetical protein M3Q75_07965 [Gemmatimonadota bacterium]|nr:hypothetical protein [Gemmatimonadota bacterium]